MNRLWVRALCLPLPSPKEKKQPKHIDCEVGPEWQWAEKGQGVCGHIERNATPHITLPALSSLTLIYRHTCLRKWHKCKPTHTRTHKHTRIYRYTHTHTHIHTRWYCTNQYQQTVLCLLDKSVSDCCPLRPEEWTAMPMPSRRDLDAKQTAGSL